MTSGSPAVASELAAEAVRVYRRYQTEIVEALNLCPWAARAREEGRVRELVLPEPGLNVDRTLAAIETLASDPAVEIGLLLFPRVVLPPRSFERFVSDLSHAEGERRPIGTVPFALAAFHPDSPLDLAEPERLIPFLRRSPDPTIQLVRLSSLDRVRDGFHEGTAFVDVSVLMARAAVPGESLGLRERIARANERTVQRVGVAEVEGRLTAILRDRDESYARFGIVGRRAW